MSTRRGNHADGPNRPDLMNRWMRPDTPPRLPAAPIVLNPLARRKEHIVTPAI